MARILVAEDNAALRLLYTIWLESAGHDVTTAVDGRDAIAQIQRRIPDAAVLDVEMPYVDGLAVCRYLHALAPGVPILVVTALEDAHADAANAGAGLILPKPCDRDQLVEAVDTLYAALTIV
jgi:CheY-like chemotaxis protein